MNPATRAAGTAAPCWSQCRPRSHPPHVQPRARESRRACAAAVGNHLTLASCLSDIAHWTAGTTSEKSPIGGAEKMLTDELRVTEKDRECLVRCVSDAFEALKIIPGIDANGPILVWLSGHLLHLHQQGAASPPR